MPTQPQQICGSTDTASGEPCQHPAGWGLDRDDAEYCVEHPPEGSVEDAAERSGFEASPTARLTGPNTPDLSAYLPTATERGDWQGAFSTFSEYHAAGIGLGVGAAAAAVARPEIMLSVALVATGEAGAQRDRLADVAAEPAYALVGLAVGYLAVGFGVNPEAIQRLAELATGLTPKTLPL